MSSERPIVLIGPAHPLRGGIAHFNESFASALEQAGHPVYIVSFYLQYPKILFPGKTQKTTDPPPENLRIHPWLSSVNPVSWFRAARRIAALNPRMVVVRFWLPFMGPALGAVSRSLRKKGIAVVGLVDNAVPHEARPMDRALSRLFLKRCSAFVTLSQSVARDLEQLAPGKPTLIKPHPIYDIFGAPATRPEAMQALKLDPDFRYVLFFGFVRKYKGLDLLLEAMAHDLMRALPDVKLLVAGEFYDDKKPYLDFLHRHGIAERVVVHDRYIPESEVKYWFTAASIVAQTYRSATQSGVTQIAYHFGRPMLVTDVGGLAEIVDHEKVGYVSPPEPRAIAEDLHRFFVQNRERDFAAAAQAGRDRFSWSGFVGDFLSFTSQKIE